MGLTDHAQIVEDMTLGQTVLPRVGPGGTAVEIYQPDGTTRISTISGNPLTPPRRFEQTITSSTTVTIDPVNTGMEQVVKVDGEHTITFDLASSLPTRPASGTVLILVEADAGNASPIIVQFLGFLDQHTRQPPANVLVDPGDTRSIVLFATNWTNGPIYASTGTGSVGTQLATPTGRVGWRAGRRADDLADLTPLEFANINWSGGEWVGPTTLPLRTYRKNNAGVFGSTAFDAVATIIRAGDSGPGGSASTYNPNTGTWTGANLGWLGAADNVDARTNNQSGLWADTTPDPRVLSIDVDVNQNNQAAGTAWTQNTTYGMVIEFSFFIAGTSTPIALNTRHTVGAIQDESVSRRSLTAFDQNVEMIIWPASGRDLTRVALPWVTAQLFPEIYGVVYAGTNPVGSDPQKNQVTGIFLEKASYRVLYGVQVTAAGGNKQNRVLTTTSDAIVDTPAPVIERLGPNPSAHPEVYHEIITEAGGTAWVNTSNGARSAPIVTPGLPFTARLTNNTVITGDTIPTTAFPVVHNWDLSAPFAPLSVQVVNASGGLATGWNVTNLTKNGFTVNITPAPPNGEEWTIVTVA